MRKLLAVAACAMGVWMFGACGGDNNGSGSGSGTDSGTDSGTVLDPVEACKQIFTVICDKTFKCYTKEELDLAKDKVGLNAADCAIKFSATCTPEMRNCNAGETYHADKMQACLDGYKTFTCEDIKRDPTVDPAACDQVCTK